MSPISPRHAYYRVDRLAAMLIEFFARRYVVRAHNPIYLDEAPSPSQRSPRSKRKGIPLAFEPAYPKGHTARDRRADTYLS